MQDRTFSSFKNRLLFLSQLQETQLRDRDELQDTQLRERDKDRDELQDTQLRERDELQETQLRERDELQGTQPRDRDELQETQLRDRDELQGTQLRDRDRDMVFLNELQDTQLWDKETCSSPQHHNVTQSESLSSLDSLEMEDGLNHNNTVQRVHSSWLDHQRHPNGPSSDLSFCPPTKSFLSGNLLIQQGKVDASPQPPRPRQTEESVGDCNSRLHQLSQATGWQSCTDQSSSQSNTITQPPLLSVSHHSLLTLSGIIDTSSIRSDNGDQHSQEGESHLRGDHRVSGVIACSKASTPDRTLLEFTSCLIPEGKLEFRQQVRDPEDKYSKQPSATQVLLPGKTCSHKDLLCEAPSSNPDHILSYNTKSSSGVREDTANIQPTKSTQHQSHGSKPSVEDAMNNLNKGTNSEPKTGSNSEPKAGSNSEPKARPNSKPKAGSNSEPKARTNSEPKARPNSEPKAERSKNTDPLSQTLGHCNIRSDFPKGLKSLQVEITPTHLPDTPPSPPPVAAVSTTTDHKGTEVRCIKGILKKQSKYGVSGGNACSGMYNARHLIFTKQFTMSIRDSVELTRRKGKDADKMIKKKIRWFDEVNLEEEEEMERSPITNNKCVSEYPLPPHKHSASSDHQQGQGQTVATNTPLASTGYHFTKQAWADVRVQESRLQGHQGIQEARETRVEAREVKVQRGSSGRTVCPRVPRRVRSARAGMDPVSSRSRKGTVIRPQSATEASSHVPWVTHGKVMVPRPPPRTETMEPKTHTRETDAVIRTPYNMDPTNHTTKTPYNMDQSNSAATKTGIPVDEALCNNNTLDSLAPSQTRTHVIRADSSVISNPSKATPMSGQQDAQGEAARWGLLYHENGLCLDRTPTDEEISQLWHGVRSALATKDGDPITVLPQARANLSRVTINGDSLINGVKAITTMGDFFLSPTNARSVVRRRPQESRGSGARRRGTTGSGNRRLPLPSQSQVQASLPLPSQSQVQASLPLPSQSQVQASLPLPSQSQVQASLPLPSQSQVQASLPLPSQSQVQASLPLPSQCQVQASLPLPSQSQVQVQASLPLPSQSQVQASLPLPSQSQVQASLPLPSQSQVQASLPLPSQSQVQASLPLPSQSQVQASLPLPSQVQASLPLPSQSQVQASLPLPSQSQVQASLPLPSQVQASLPLPSQSQVQASLPLPSQVQASLPLPSQSQVQASLPLPSQVQASLPLPSQVQASLPLPSQVQASLPLPSQVQASLPLPSQSQVQASLPLPSQSQVQASLPLPSQCQVQASLPLPSQSQVQVQASLPLPSQSQVQASLPLPSQSQVQASLPLPSQSQVQASLPLPSQSQVQASLPLPSQVQASLPLPSQSQVQASLPLPSQSQVQASLPLPSQVQASLPLPSQSQVQASLPLPSQVQASLPLPSQSQVQASLPLPSQVQASLPLPSQVQASLPLPSQVQASL
uniref:Uncharacterized protein n=1 Tax=Oncorhynchus kisutch TaxID=8019 RepID=A0A8C7I2K1_ONCKI